VRILVTNDDGIDSAGLVALAAAAVDAGAEVAGSSVVVAAPRRDSSGSSASLVAVEDRGRFLVEERELPGLPGVAAWAVEGAPAFIVRAALTGAFGPEPDLVVSGVNRGPNTGHAVLHSGTVGAVLTAGVAGLGGMAVSIGMGEPYHWDTARTVARAALGWMLDGDRPGAKGLVLNVNVPNVALGALTGFEPARLADFGVVQATVAETGSGYVKLNYRQVDGPLEPGTDTALLAEGKACYTALRSVDEDPEADLEGLGDVLAP